MYYIYYQALQYTNLGIFIDNIKYFMVTHFMILHNKLFTDAGKAISFVL